VFQAPYYYFWTMAMLFSVPLAAMAFSIAYTALSSNRQPLWVTLPAFFMIHVVGLGIFVGLPLDSDWLQYRSRESWAWWIGFHGGSILSVFGFGWTLWIGLRKPARPAVQRGFDVRFREGGNNEMRMS